MSFPRSEIFLLHHPCILALESGGGHGGGDGGRDGGQGDGVVGGSEGGR